MHRLKLLIVEHMLHMPPCAATSTHALHAPDTQPSRALHARDHQSLSSSCTCQCLHHQFTSAPRVNCLCQHTSAIDFHCWALTFWQKVKKFQQGLSCSVFFHRFWFWALFLHLRSLNTTFWSFSSLWLNKTNEISYVLSPLCWMVLLAIVHGLRIWLSFSRVVNYTYTYTQETSK